MPTCAASSRTWSPDPCDTSGPPGTVRAIASPDAVDELTSLRNRSGCGASEGRPDPTTLVDLDRYPVEPLPAGHPQAARRADVVASARSALTAQGVAVLPGFVPAEALTVMVDDARSLAPLAHRSVAKGTAYLAAPADDVPEGHPRRTVIESSLGAVAYDLFPAFSPIRALYEWEPLMAFVAELLDEPVLHHYADPFGALNLAVMHDGDVLGWHFDQTDFVVSIALQQSEAGGDFDAVPHLRSIDDERYDAVAAVLAGDAAVPVTTMAMEPGTLMVFQGRRSLHRVSPVSGPTPRLVALLAYDTKPGTDSTDRLKLSRYGRLP